MPEKKRQHYVSRFYMKNFSIGLNRKTIGIFNIESKKFIPAVSIKDQSYKNYFYGKDGVIENALGLLETPASKIISNIIKYQRYPIKMSEEHIIMLTFTIFLYRRTQYSADEKNEYTDKLIKKIYSKDSRVNKTFDQVKFGFENAAQVCLQIAAQCLPVTFDLNYKILSNKTKNVFITSDNPVIFYNQFLESRKTYGSNVGLAIKGLQIFLPISPKYLILFFDQGVYRIGNKKDKIINVLNESDVNVLNNLQFVNAYKNLYFNEDISLDYILNILNKMKKYRRKSKSFVHEYQGETKPDGTTSSLIHSYRNDIRIGLNLSFIKITKKAKNYDLGNKVVHVRNEDLVNIQEEFLDLIYQGIYSPYQFGTFMKNRLNKR